jgi:hypothetical protein
LDYLRSDPALWAFAGALALRLRRHFKLGAEAASALHPVWDSLAVAALIYFATLVAMGLSADRYVAPVDMIALLFGARELGFYAKSTQASRWLVPSSIVVVSAASLVFGVTRLLEYKSIQIGTVELARFIQRYASQREGQVRLFFPSAEGWRLLNLQVYVRYRHGAVAQRLRYAAPHEFPKGQCVEYRPEECAADPSPLPGDLVVQLPDDAERIDLPKTRQVFAYSLWPGGMPSWLGHLVHREAPLYAGRDMPRGWLSATVAERSAD